MDELLQEMIDPEPPRRDAARRRRLWASIAVFGLAGVGITSLTTSALFTDTDTVAGDLLTGTVDISSALAGSDLATTLSIPASGMAPNGTYTGQVTVTNAGSLELRYGVRYFAVQKSTGLVASPTLGTTVTSGDLRNVLSLAVYPPASGATCQATTAPTAVTGSTSSTLGAVAQLDNTGATQTILGDPANTATTYRTLASTKNEVLCVQVHMDATAGNQYQATGATITLQFDAEQTVNNP